MIRHSGTSVCIALSMLLLCACESLNPSQSRLPDSSHTVRGESDVNDYMDMLARLSSTDPVQQSDTFYQVEQASLQAPTTMNQLRYALALAMPGHPASDPVKAKKLLDQALLYPERLSVSELALGKSMLHVTEQWLKLQAENRRLLATVDDRTRAQSNSERRLQAQSEELTKLRKALDAAQQKLDAIKDIEKSISERSTTPAGTRDTGNRDSTNQTQTTPAGR